MKSGSHLDFSKAYLKDSLVCVSALSRWVPLCPARFQALNVVRSLFCFKCALSMLCGLQVSC